MALTCNCYMDVYVLYTFLSVSNKCPTEPQSLTGLPIICGDPPSQEPNDGLHFNAYPTHFPARSVVSMITGAGRLSVLCQVNHHRLVMRHPPDQDGNSAAQGE